MAKSSKDIKQLKEMHDKEVKSFEKTHKTLSKQDNIVAETENKISAVDYYNSLSDGEKKEFQDQLQKKKLRENYGAYLLYVYGNQPDYQLTRFHRFLANLFQSVVQRIEKGEKVRVAISTPPQHGKTQTLTATGPTWFIGRNPDLRVIITSYNAETAERFGDTARQIVREYGKDIFGIEISDSQDNKTLFNIKKHAGGILSTGLGGSLTSNNGALIIVDDPFKSEMEANTPAKRNEVWSNFTSAVMTRQRGAGNGIIVIHTRWHEDDLIGRLKALDDGEWIIINIPAVWEKGVDRLLHRKIGETLCPELGFDAKWAESMKKTIGLKQFNALYQGEPYTEGGEIVKRTFIQNYDEKTKPSVFEELVLSCDLSFGGTKSNNDPVCLSVWGRLGGNHYLVEVINKKMTFTQTLESIRYLCGKYPQMKKKLIERKANGSATIEMLNKEIGGFIAFDPGAKSKLERLELCMPYFEAGNIYFPTEKICPTIEELIQQLVRFPKSTHDDFVDTISQYLLNYEYKYNGGKILTDSYYSTVSDVFRGIKI